MAAGVQKFACAPGLLSQVDDAAVVGERGAAGNPSRRSRPLYMRHGREPGSLRGGPPRGLGRIKRLDMAADRRSEVVAHQSLPISRPVQIRSANCPRADGRHD